MDNSDQFDSLLSQLLGYSGNSNNGSKGHDQTHDGSLQNLTPSQILVIAGILGNALSVESILVDRNQTVNIVLAGSLKRRTELDRLITDLSSKSVGEVIKALLNNFG